MREGQGKPSWRQCELNDKENIHILKYDFSCLHFFNVLVCFRMFGSNLPMFQASALCFQTVSISRRLKGPFQDAFVSHRLEIDRFFLKFLFIR